MTLYWKAGSVSNPQLYAADDDGANAHAVGVGADLTYALDGGRLLFSGYGFGSTQSLGVTNGAAGSAVKLATVTVGAWVGRLGAKVFFTAASGTELWATDGTTSGTSKVGALSTASSGALDFTVFGGKLFWTQGSTRTLWSTDGSAPSQVFAPTGGSLTAATSDTGPTLKVVGSQLFFTARTSATGLELYATDGTTAGTRLVKDIYAGADDSRPQELTVLGGKLVFAASDNANGREIWSSDGTAGGTVLLKNIQPSSQTSSDPLAFTLAGDKVFFTAVTEVGRELWETDGTTAGTKLVKNIGIDLYPLPQFPTYIQPIDGQVTGIAAFGSKVVFKATDTVAGSELWASDGTAEGTFRLGDLLPGPANGVQSVTDTNADRKSDQVVVSEGRVFFTAWTSSGQEVWTTDGTIAGTRMVKDVDATGGSNPTNLTAVKGGVAFSAYTLASGREAWFSDGTAAGTRLILDAAVGADTSEFNGASYYDETPVRVGANWVFSAITPDNGRELWVLDGSPQGAHLLADIGEGSYFGINIRWQPGLESEALTSGAFLGDGRLVFLGNSLVTGGEAWVTDGTSAGTFLLKDAYPGPNSQYTSGPGEFTSFQGRVFYTTNAPDTGFELWSTDGTAAGTALVKDIQGPQYGQNAGSVPRALTAAGSNLFFTAYTYDLGTELYVTDGTTSGTRLVKDTNPGSGGMYLQKNVMFPLGDKVLFVNETGSSNREMWVSDGTADGTKMLRDIYEGASGSNILNVTKFGAGRYVFSANSQGGGQELWITDGTTEGTAQVRDINPGAGGSAPTNFFQYGGRLFFNATSNTQSGLWSSDGTTAGTYRVGGEVSSSAKVGDLGAFFRNTYTNTGNLSTSYYTYQLWTGTGDLSNAAVLTDAAGVGLIVEQYSPLELHDSRLLFQAHVQGNVTPYWYSTDGTAAGTTRHGPTSATASTLNVLDDPTELDNSVYVGGTQLRFRGPTGLYTEVTNYQTQAGSNPFQFVSSPSGSAPILSGAGAVGPIFDHASTGLFTNVAVADGSPAGGQITARVTPFYAGAGAYTAASLAASGFVQAGDGVASFTGTAAQVQTALRALVWEPSVYVARGGQTVEQSFTVQLAGAAGSSTAATLLTIAGTDDAPTAPDLTNATDSGRSATDDLTNAAAPVFAGRADAGATVQLLDGPTVVATLTAGGQGTYSFTPTLAEGRHTLTASSAGGASSPLTVTIDRTAPAPVASGATIVHGDLFYLTPQHLSYTDSYAAPEDVVFTITGSTSYGRLYLDSQELASGSFTQAQVNAGRVRYYNQAVRIGTEPVPLSVTDVAGNSRTTGVLTFQVTNTAPVGVDDTISVPGTTAVGATSRAAGVLANDTDADVFDIAQQRLYASAVKAGLAGGSGTYTATNQGGFATGAYGVLQLQQSGTYTYTPNSSVGQLTTPQTDVFTYKVSDYFAESTATLTFMVGPQGVAPTLSGAPASRAVADSVGDLAVFAAMSIGDANAAGTQVTVTVQLLQGSFVGEWGHADAWSVNSNNTVRTFTSTAAQATAALQALSFTYKDNYRAPGEVYATEFRVTAQNSYGSATVNSVLVNVTSVNDAPVTADDTNSLPQRLSIPGDITLNDRDGDLGDRVMVLTGRTGQTPAVTVAFTGQTDIVGAYGVLHISRNGAYTYDAVSEGLAVGVSATDVFDLEVSDLYGGMSAERLTVTVTGSASGDARDNLLVGSGGADVLTGAGGRDVLNGGFGADVLYGNQDDDTLYGNQDNDVIYGGQGNDTAYGGQGDDALYGNLGDDRLVGNLGDDVLNGGAGANTLDGGDGVDTATYADAAVRVNVSLLLQGQSQTTGVSSDTLTRVENLTGSAFADVLTGDTGDNLLTGGYGADILWGGYGVDMLYGNQDDDVLYGNQDDDALYGGQGSDVLYGGQGADVLQGGAGADILFGNLGADTFRYTATADSTPTGSDTIADFSTAQGDKIDLRAVHTGGLADSFTITSSATQTFLEVHVIGGDMRIALTGANVLALTDILWG